MALLETLTDDFNGTTLDPQWTPVIVAPGTVTVADGGLQAYTGGSAGAGNLRSTTSYTIATGSVIAVKLTRETASSSYTNQLVFGYSPSSTTGGNSILLIQSGTIYWYAYNAAGTGGVVSSTTYNATSMAWLRLRFGVTGNSIATYYETSPDGVTWTQRGTSTQSWSGAAGYARLYCSGGGDNTPRTAVWDKVNLSPNALNPNSITDAETLDPPTIGAPVIVKPNNVTDPETLDPPTITLGTTATPGSVTDPDQLGSPSIAPLITPDSINDTETLDPPTITAPQTTIAAPDPITDPETLDPPDLIWVREKDNWDYGAGVYNHGPYYGYITPTPGCTDNYDYNYGLYSCGIYYGQTEPEHCAEPLFGDLAPTTGPLHILGIGPWSPTIQWRGIPNQGVNAGQYPARPALALPPATNKSFTLRLNAGSEARTDLNLPRTDALIIDEMDTDLWWRRKDPRTGILEVIGRFNCANIDLSTSDTGINIAAQWDDYVTVLNARMITKYLHPTYEPPTTQWAKGTKVTDILAWCLPTNTGLDLSEITGDNPYPLGVTKQVYEIGPGVLIEDIMDNLEAMSQNTWEWWIETPTDVNAAPKLRFTLGQRGTNKGVTLYDNGIGPTNIASWTRTGHTGNYANTLYLSGQAVDDSSKKAGGVIEQIPTEIRQYGQRDAQDGTSSASGGDINQLRQAANKKLAQLADRRPTYSITLAQGFWRGRNHIDVGDTIRIIIKLGAEHINDTYRVTEITVDIDDNNTEHVTLTLGKRPTSPDPRSKYSPTMRILRYLRNYTPSDGYIAPPENTEE